MNAMRILSYGMVWIWQDGKASVWEPDVVICHPEIVAALDARDRARLDALARPIAQADIVAERARFRDDHDEIGVALCDVAMARIVRPDMYAVPEAQQFTLRRTLNLSGPDAWERVERAIRSRMLQEAESLGSPP